MRIFLLIKKQASTLLTQNINRLGLADIVFASLIVDYTQSQLLIDFFEQTPHSDFPNTIYNKITIRNAKREITFTKKIKGTNEHLSHDEFIFSLGDQIKIYHAEPNRLKVNSFYQGIINPKSKTNILTINKKGLKNIDSLNDPETQLIERIENEVKFLLSYQDCISTNNTPLDNFDGDNFTIAAKGIDDF